MTPAPAVPVFANVACLRLPRFGERPVAQQAALKEALEARVREAVAPLPAGERIVLDAADGVAVVLFGAPARALDLARALAVAGGEDAPRAGLDHGPLAVTGRDPAATVFGDGVAAAAAAARFAEPGHLLVTASFARALEATHPDRAAELAPAGEYTDTRVRLHAFYALDPKRLAARRSRLSAYALAGILGILLLGVGGREAIRRFFPPAPAVISLDVKPRGEVLVDGRLRGTTPPLTTLEVPDGRHQVLVRHGTYPPLDLVVVLEPGEKMAITHTFAGERSPARPEGFWRGLRRRFAL